MAGLTFEELFTQSYPDPEEVAREALNGLPEPTQAELDKHHSKITCWPYCQCALCELRAL